MGYPMTWKRVVNRNHLEKDSPEWLAYKTTSILPEHEELVSHWNKAAEGFNLKVRILMDDVRRLQRDALDEVVIASRIASVTGIDKAAVATVLQAFFNL